MSNSPQRVKASGIKLLKKEGVKLDDVPEYIRASHIRGRDLTTAHQLSQRKYTPLEALKLVSDCKLSSRGYKSLQSSLKFMTGRTILPNYKLTLEEKVQCYPDIDQLSTIEIRSTIKSVLEKIIER